MGFRGLCIKINEAQMRARTLGTLRQAQGRLYFFEKAIEYGSFLSLVLLNELFPNTNTEIFLAVKKTRAKLAQKKSSAADCVRKREEDIGYLGDMIGSYFWVALARASS
jgi:hypothetical protein